MPLGFYFNQTRCTGCFTCVVACKDWHDVPAGPASWIRIDTIERGKYPDLFVSHLFSTCFHCADAPCIGACPVNAITRQVEDGIVVVEPETCIGFESCGASCRIACPYGAPQFRNETDAKMEKCDLCRERWAEGKKPICVDACPTRALDAAPLGELEAKYGSNHVAEGFTYHEEIKPSVVLRAKTG